MFYVVDIHMPSGFQFADHSVCSEEQIRQYEDEWGQVYKVAGPFESHRDAVQYRNSMVSLDDSIMADIEVAELEMEGLWDA